MKTGRVHDERDAWHQVAVGLQAGLSTHQGPSRRNHWGQWHKLPCFCSCFCSRSRSCPIPQPAKTSVPPLMLKLVVPKTNPNLFAEGMPPARGPGAAASAGNYQGLWAPWLPGEAGAAASHSAQLHIRLHTQGRRECEERQATCRALRGQRGYRPADFEVCVHAKVLSRKGQVPGSLLDQLWIDEDGFGASSLARTVAAAPSCVCKGNKWSSSLAPRCRRPRILLYLREEQGARAEQVGELMLEHGRITWVWHEELLKHLLCMCMCMWECKHVDSMLHDVT